jgi:type I restriction enzyme S subunit
MTTTKTLGEVLEIRKGKKAEAVADSKVIGSFPYIQIDEVRGVQPSKFAIDPRPVLATRDDLCIVWDGANAGTVGYGVSGAVGSTVARMRLKNPQEWDTRFLGRLLEGKFSQLNQEAHGRGATIPHVDKARLEAIEFPKIPPSDQRRIAAILDMADAIRRKREQSLALADDFIRSVFLEMFGDPIVNAKGLPRQPLGQFGKIVTGNTPPRSDPDNFGDAVEWIKSDNVNTEEHFLTRAVEGLSVKGKALGRIVPKGSILITCIAGSPASIGRAAIADRSVAFNQQINAITPYKDVNLYFLYAQFLIGKPLVLRSSTNSMKGMISKGEFQKIEFLRPEPREQAKFGKVFEKQIEACRLLREASIQAAELLSTLSQRAFRGEI